MWWLPLALADDPSMTCCDHAAVARNLGYYLRMQVALATGDDRRVDGLIYSWEPIARRTSSELPAGEREVLLGVADALVALKGKPSRERVLDAFPSISHALTWLVIRHAAGEQPVVEGVCDGRGWLQEVGPVASPYGCGELRVP